MFGHGPKAAVIGPVNAEDAGRKSITKEWNRNLYDYSAKEQRNQDLLEQNVNDSHMEILHKWTRLKPSHRLMAYRFD